MNRHMALQVYSVIKWVSDVKDVMSTVMVLDRRVLLYRSI